MKSVTDISLQILALSEVAQKVLSDWPSILAVASVGWLSGRHLPTVTVVRSVLNSRAQELGVLPSDIPDSKLIEVSEASGRTPTARILGYGSVVAFAAGMLAFLTFRAAFPDVPRWWGYFVAPAVCLLFSLPILRLRQRSIFEQLRRIIGRTEATSGN
jgi:hypothetical protein